MRSSPSRGLHAYPAGVCTRLHAPRVLPAGQGGHPQPCAAARGTAAHAGEVQSEDRDGASESAGGDEAGADGQRRRPGSVPREARPSS